jgi:hypothetical protein
MSEVFVTKDLIQEAWCVALTGLTLVLVLVRWIVCVCVCVRVDGRRGLI